MQLSELVAQVEENVGRDDKTASVPTYINLALQRIANDYPRFVQWQEISKETIDPDDPDQDARRIELPWNLHRITNVIVPEAPIENLVSITPNRYDEMFPDALTEPKRTGYPEVFAKYGNYMEVYPVPDFEVTYYIRWAKKPPKLEDDTDEPLIPYDNVIIECASMIFYNRLGMTEESAQQYQIYRSYLKSAIGQDKDTNSANDYKLRGFDSGRTRKDFSTARDRIW